MRLWLPLSIGSRIRERWIYPEGEDGQVEPQVAGYQIEGKVPLEDAEAALRGVTLFDACDKPRVYAAELARLKVLTVSKHLTAEDLTLQIAVMTDEISTFPVDVARHACRTWVQGNKYFPAWAELKALCEGAVRFRRDLATALREIIEAAKARKSEHASTRGACAVWRDNESAIRASVGDKAWRTWLLQLTPHADDGRVLVLAAPTRFMCDLIEERFGSALQQVVGREVKFIVTRYASPAARRRAGEGG